MSAIDLSNYQRDHREKAMTDRSTAQTVAIIGAGIGGRYLVAQLGITGFKLRLSRY